MIADGHHVALEMLRLVAAAVPGRWALVTDATMATGLPPGDYGLSPATLVPGAPADLVVLDPDLSAVRTLVAGREADR